MRNVEKHIDEIVSRVLSEAVSFKTDHIMGMATEELHGGQKKLDKNKNGKIDADDFKKLRKVKSGLKKNKMTLPEVDGGYGRDGSYRNYNVDPYDPVNNPNDMEGDSYQPGVYPFKDTRTPEEKEADGLKSYNDSFKPNVIPKKKGLMSRVQDFFKEGEDDDKKRKVEKPKKPRTPAGFEYGEIVSGDMGEDEVEEGNAFSGALDKAKKEGKSSFSVDGKKYQVKENEPLYRGTKYVDEEMNEYSFGDETNDDDLGYNDMLPSAKYEKEMHRTPHKIKNMGESKKNTLQLTEDEIIDMIEKIVMEQTQVKTTNKSLKTSKTENDNYIKSVTKKMKEYLKDGSKADYNMNPEIFPKGNGELEKMAKKAYIPSGAVEEFIDNFVYSPGMESLQYDEIKPNEEWLEKNLEGSAMTGNGKGGNAIDTGLGKKINAKRKKNLYGKEKNRSYNRVAQPIVHDEAGEGAGEKQLTDMFKKLGESDEKKTKLINEEMEKMKHLLGYKKKTQ